MSETRGARHKRLAARLGAEAHTRVPLPDRIFLPDLSLPPPAETGQQAPGKKGRHFGGRRVDNPCSAWLTTRCTPAFREAVLAAARDAGMEISDYVHARLGDNSRKPRAHRSGHDIELLRQILAQMGKRGSNLNQIAYHLNSCDFRDTADELLAMQADHAAALAEHQEVCAAIKKALGV